MSKGTIIGYAMAAIVCIALGLAVASVGIYPCGYWGTTELYEEEGFAGYGYHSLIDVAGEGFFWEADDIPVPNPNYLKIGPPFYAVGYWWVSLLYIPIYIGILYLGWMIAGGKERFSVFSLPSRRSRTRQE